MKYLVSLFVWILVLAELMVARQLEAAAIDERQLANVRIDHDIIAENQRVLSILLDVLRGTGIPGGFAEIAGCSDAPKGSLKLKRGITVREAMDALVAANASYQWRLEGGVVNLMPRGGVPLLDAKIAKFQMDATDREAPAIFQDLLRLPEVRERATALGLNPGLGQGGPGVVDEHPVPRQPVPIHLGVNNLSLRDAFNRIMQTSRNAIWIYHETDCNGNKTYIVETTSDY